MFLSIYARFLFGSSILLFNGLMCMFFYRSIVNAIVKKLLIGGALCCVMYSSLAQAQTSELVGLGDLPGGIFFSQANGISADGSVVVGETESASGFEAFR